MAASSVLVDASQGVGQQPEQLSDLTLRPRVGESAASRMACVEVVPAPRWSVSRVSAGSTSRLRLPLRPFQHCREVQPGSSSLPVNALGVDSEFDKKPISNGHG